MELAHFVVQCQWPESSASLHWNWRETILTENTEAACVDSAGPGWRFVGFSHCYPFLTYSHFIHVKQNEKYHCSVLVAFSSDFASERKNPDRWHSNQFECSFRIVENNCDCEMSVCRYSPCWASWLLPSIYNWALHSALSSSDRCLSLHLLVYELGSALLTTPDNTQHITGLETL